MTVEVINADFRDAIAAMPDASFDCILTDPPYGETSLEWDRWPVGWPAMVRRLLKRSGSMWVFGSQRMFLERAGEFVGWSFAQDLIWEKHNGSGFHADRFRRVHENACQFYRSDAPWAGVYRSPQVTFDAKARKVNARATRVPHTGEIGPYVYETVEGGPRLMRSVIYARSEHGRALHPTQKPLDVVEPMLRYACPPGGSVLDIFAGSGTTGVAAKRNGMSAVLIEGSARFDSVIRARLAGDESMLHGAHAAAAADWGAAR